MKIPQEYLKEANYEGTRLIEVVDEKVKELQGELTKLQLEANPHLKIMEDITPKLDPLFTKLRELEEQKTKIRDEMAPIRDPYDKELLAVQKIDQKAQLIKNKIQPLILKMVNPLLGEFETARQLIEKDGKLFVEVVDEVEEKIKTLRAAKAKK
jgi:predicted  nucleic acid-binding Zn-ribbon protein